MAVEILLPRLGWDMTEGTFGEWLKQNGETIQPGDQLFTVEGDKATQEIESMDTGILHIHPNGPQTGDTVSVGTLLAYIAAPGEVVDFQGESTVVTTTDPAALPKSQLAPTEERSTHEQGSLSTANASPRARRIAAELNIDWIQLQGSGRNGRIIERDIRAAAARRPKPTTVIRATPVAARMASARGVDLNEIAKEIPGQRIQRQDVERAIAAQTTTDIPAATDGQETRIPLTHIRRLIAQRMSHSVQTAAAVTLTTEADATEFVALRQQLIAAYGPRGMAVPAYHDLFIKLTAVALQEHPMLNAMWDDEAIILSQGIHIGLAVDTEDGLLVPVVKDVQQKDLRTIANESHALIEQAKTKTIRSDQLQGGTFTITNLGMHNIDIFTPIINLPQCAILGVGRIVEKPAVHNGAIVPRHMVSLSLTFDHRVIDGVPAARGLDRIREFIETPLLWLL